MVHQHDSAKGAEVFLRMDISSAKYKSTRGESTKLVKINHCQKKRNSFFAIYPLLRERERESQDVPTFRNKLKVVPHCAYIILNLHFKQIANFCLQIDDLRRVANIIRGLDFNFLML